MNVLTKRAKGNILNIQTYKKGGKNMKKIIKWITLAAASALTCVAFMACAPTSLDKAYEKLAMEGYKVQIIEADVNIKGHVGGINAQRTETDDGAVDMDVLMAYLFDSKSAAKEFYEEQLGKTSENDVGSLLREGKWVYMGTADAVDDFID